MGWFSYIIWWVSTEIKSNLSVPLAEWFLLVFLYKSWYLPIFKLLYSTPSHLQNQTHQCSIFWMNWSILLPYIKPLPCFTAAIVVGFAFINDFASTLDLIDKSDKPIKLSVCPLFPASCACWQVAAGGWSAQSHRCTGRSTPSSTLSPTAPTCCSSGSWLYPRASRLDSPSLIWTLKPLQAASTTL